MWNGKMVVYGIRQGVGQVKLINSAVSVEEAKGKVTAQQAAKIQLIQEVKTYAKNQLHLNVDERSYSSFVLQDSTSTMWVVTAAEPFALQDYNWNYGPVGKMPYKGFFDYSLAKKEEEFISKQGYDTELGTASGWSTLGILSEPILSNMLERDSARLVELIIHELTHATIYHFGETTWNENMATFIGREGTKRFLIEELKDTTLLLRYEESLQQKELRSQFIQAKAKALNNLYESGPFKVLSSQEKVELKTTFMQEFVTAYKTQFPRRKHNVSILPNNTLFTDFLMYHSNLDSLELVLQHQYQGDLPQLILEHK